LDEKLSSKIVAKFYYYFNMFTHSNEPSRNFFFLASLASAARVGVEFMFRSQSSSSRYKKKILSGNQERLLH
jgi:hypothetical protein